MSCKNEIAQLNDRLRANVIRNAIVLNVLSRKSVVYSYSCAYIFVSAFSGVLEFATMLNFTLPACVLVSARSRPGFRETRRDSFGAA